MTNSSSAREFILGRVTAPCGRQARAPRPPFPASAREQGDVETDISSMLDSIEKLGGKTERICSREQLLSACEVLVREQAIKKATSWPGGLVQEFGLAAAFEQLGVKWVSPFAGKHELAECDLGITGADAALPDTGTLVLRSTRDQPAPISLLPRVHLALFEPRAFRRDLAQVFAEFKDSSRLVLITGPSRTADIEKVLTIGVHGPQSFYAWCWLGAAALPKA